MASSRVRLPTLRDMLRDTLSHTLSAPWHLGVASTGPLPAGFSPLGHPFPHVALSPSGAQASTSVLCVALAQSPFPLPQARVQNPVWFLEAHLYAATTSLPNVRLNVAPQPSQSTGFLSLGPPALALGFYSSGFHMSASPEGCKPLSRNTISIRGVVFYGPSGVITMEGLQKDLRWVLHQG